MRRSVSVFAIVVVLLLVGSSPVVAAKPIHTPSEIFEPTEIPAGTACDFGVTLVTTVLSAKTSVWEAADGTVRILDRGFAAGYAESDQGRRFDARGGYRIEIVIHPDGSVEVSVSGVLFAWYFEGDPVVGLPAPGAYAVNGHGTESYAPDGSLIGARFYGGKVIDLCDLLAPDPS